MKKEDFYKQYLSKEWKSLRLEILKRDNYKCLECSSKKELQVHHTYYPENGNILDVENESLITLCKRCHSKKHNKSYSILKTKKPKKKKVNNKFAKFGYKITAKGIYYKCKKLA